MLEWIYSFDPLTVAYVCLVVGGLCTIGVLYLTLSIRKDNQAIRAIDEEINKLEEDERRKMAEAEPIVNRAIDALIAYNLRTKNGAERIQVEAWAITILTGLEFDYVVPYTQKRQSVLNAHNKARGLTSPALWGRVGYLKDEIMNYKPQQIA